MTARIWIVLFLLLACGSDAFAEYTGKFPVDEKTAECVKKLSSEATDREGSTCCSDADGSEPEAVRQYGQDKNGKPQYMVQFTVDGKQLWFKVPPEAVLPPGNACGIQRTLAWKSRVNGDGPENLIKIRCFLLGTMY